MGWQVSFLRPTLGLPRRTFQGLPEQNLCLDLLHSKAGALPRHFEQPSRGGIRRGIKCPKFSLGLPPPFRTPVFLLRRTAKPVHALLVASTTLLSAELKTTTYPFHRVGPPRTGFPNGNPFSKLQPPISGSKTHPSLQGIKAVYKKFIKMPNIKAGEGCCMQPQWESKFTVVPAESTAGECFETGKGFIQVFSFVYPIRTT